MNAESQLELARRLDEAIRNQQRLAQWWERYCEAKPIVWALGRRPAPVEHPFRRVA